MILKAVTSHHKDASILLTNAFIASLASCALVVLLGSCYNNLNFKYSRVFRGQQISISCSRELFIQSIPNSILCCDEHYHADEWICTAAYDRLNKVLASAAAIYIPLLPLLATLFVDFYRKYFRKTLIPASFGKHLIRVFLYLSIIAYRTFILYLGGDYVQKSLQKAHENQTCWYSNLVRSGMCYNEFDYSDHIVLFVVQYVFISAIEIAYVLERRSRTRQPLTIASLLGSADALTVIPAAALILLSLRGALFTSMFFHTVAENLTALAVIIVFAFVPLLYFSRSSYWYNMITDIPYLDKE